jgi:hypothetical protein
MGGGPMGPGGGRGPMGPGAMGGGNYGNMPGYRPPSSQTPGQLGLTENEGKIKFIKVDEVDSVPDARLADDVMPVRMAIVVGSFPWKQQLEEYRKALRFDSVDELMAAGAEPQFAGFDVERAEVHPGQAEPQWVPINLMDYYAPLALLTGKQWQKDDPKLEPVIVDPHAAWYRPKEIRDSGDQYPKVEEELTRIKDTLAALEKAQKGQVIKPKNKFKADKDSGDIFGGDDTGTAGTAGPAGGALNPAAPAKVKNPKGSDAGSTGLTGQEGVVPEYVLLRFLDVTIEPGKTYKYRFRVRMHNPNHKKEKEVAWASIAKDPELKSDWAYVADKVRVPPELYYYAVDLKTQGTPEEKRKEFWNARTPGVNEVACQIHEWLEAYVPPETSIKKGLTNYATVGDWVIAPRALLTRGAYMGETALADVPVWNVTGGHFALAQSKDRRTKKVPVFFGVGLENGPYEPLLVDFSGGLVKYDKYAGMDEDKNQPKYTAVKDTLPTEMLIMTPDGKLLLRNAEADLADKDRDERYKAWKARIDEIKQSEKPANRTPQGPGGPNPNPFGK